MTALYLLQAHRSVFIVVSPSLSPALPGPTGEKEKKGGRETGSQSAERVWKQLDARRSPLVEQASSLEFNGIPNDDSRGERSFTAGRFLRSHLASPPKENPFTGPAWQEGDVPGRGERFSFPGRAAVASAH